MNQKNRTEASRLRGMIAISLIAATGLMSSTTLAAGAKRSSTNNVATQNTDLVKRIVRTLENTPSDTRGIGLPTPLSDDDFRPLDPAQVELGKLLFHDKILSGNMNTSCATCHNMLTDTSDGLSLPMGEGAVGLGPAREDGVGHDAIHERVPRNAPHVFNLGAYEFSIMMHDGRIREDANAPSGFDTPADEDFMYGIDSALAAQACFPVTSFAEMAGQPGENPIANAVFSDDLPRVWAILAKRVALVPEYAQMFIDVYPDISDNHDITYTHIANAIGAYESAVGRADNSPFDQYLRGDTGAMSMNAVDGMILFYGKAGCAQCHSGPLQTDHSFRAIAMPQIGPGKGQNQPGYIDGLDDLGLGGETDNIEDNFKFRVPSLRNVALTGPWGHSGAYNSLEAVVRHHLDPVTSLYNYDQSQAVLPDAGILNERDFLVMNTPARVDGIAAANELAPVDLTENEFAHLMDFLNALTDTRSIDVRHAIPMRVPSGLPVYD